MDYTSVINSLFIIFVLSIPGVVLSLIHISGK